MKPLKPILSICLIAMSILLFVSCKKGTSNENAQIPNDNGQKETGIAARDNQNDSTIAICDQVWTVKNLDVSIYRDGTPIPEIKDSTAWADANFGAYCYYKNDSATYGTVYGKLYNWYAVTDTLHGGIAPIGWHVPTDDEWTTLTNCLGGQAVAGGKMKEKGTKHWFRPNLDATNSSGFTALPGGVR